MKPLFDSFWRAVACCMHPRVIALSLLPLIVMVVLSFGLGYFFWEGVVASVAVWLQSHELMQAFLGWLDRLGMDGLRSVFGPLLLLVMATPVIVLLCLLLMAVFMTPAMVELVAQPRFALLWFAHCALDCLQAMRNAEPPASLPPPVDLLPPALPGAPDLRTSNNPALPRLGDTPKPT